MKTSRVGSTVPNTSGVCFLVKVWKPEINWLSKMRLGFISQDSPASRTSVGCRKINHGPKLSGGQLLTRRRCSWLHLLQVSASSSLQLHLVSERMETDHQFCSITGDLWKCLQTQPIHLNEVLWQWNNPRPHYFQFF